MVLQNNNCAFNDEFYRQITVTAMGTIFVSTYATQMGKKIPLDKSNVQRQELLDTLNFVNEAIQFTMEFT